MATYTCPEGHTSQSSDYCDVCGSPIATGAAAAGGAAGGSGASGAGAGSATPPPLPADGASSLDLDAKAPSTVPTATSKDCPNCHAANLPAALFCEDCGYDFTTGQLPRPLDPPDGVASSGGSPAGATPADATPTGGAVVQPPPSTPGTPVVPDSAQPLTTVEYVVEVWIDPDWYEAQDVNDPCPSAGMPLVVPLRSRTALIGRTSSSRNIHPEVDVSSDTGVSRRHAQLTSDGQRWWVEDLQSANGTYVGQAGDALPTDPIAAGQKVELTEDGRVYIGAWTKLVVRKASPSEQVPV